MTLFGNFKKLFAIYMLLATFTFTFTCGYKTGKVIVMILHINVCVCVFSGVKPQDKRDGAGAHNWGTISDEIQCVALLSQARPKNSEFLKMSSNFQ